MWDNIQKNLGSYILFAIVFMALDALVLKNKISDTINDAVSGFSE